MSLLRTGDRFDHDMRPQTRRGAAPSEFDMVPAMSGRRGRQLCALALLGMFAGATVGGCDSHSKPTAVPPPSSAPAPEVSVAPPSVRPSVPPSVSASVASPSVASASSSPIVGESALTSAYPSAAAQIPAAVDVVRKFFDGINHETDTGDEAPAIATFNSQCNLCGSEVFSIKTLLDGGHTIRGGHLHLLSIDSTYQTYATIISVEVTESQDSAQQLDRAGAVIHSFPAAQPTKLDFELQVDKTPPVIWQLTRLGK